MDLSVIICAHNPRRDYLERVLEALKTQTIPRDRWELMLIDSASEQRLADLSDLSWHPDSRHIREEEVGLISARLRGIQEARGRVLIFVDDDNVLRLDYLKEVAKIDENWPILGVWGGNVEGEFEVEPRAEIVPLLPLLAIRSVNTVQWCNGIATNHALPCGAGMCVRQVVAAAYAKSVMKRGNRKSFDREGASLASGGDTDLALTSCDIGLGTGLFPELHVRHLIPRERLELGYLLKLEEAVAYGHLFVHSFRMPTPLRIPLSERIITRYSILRRRGIERAIVEARWRAKRAFFAAARNVPPHMPTGRLQS
jgi:glycosyltransferase involved in cell wall biosynthesis